MHIAITSLPGYSLEEKKQLARELKNTVAALMGVAPVTVSVSVKDLPLDPRGRGKCVILLFASFFVNLSYI